MRFPCAQPLEPRLLPKLRLHFADFPWLHCSIDQRLLAQETCCGSWYGHATRSYSSPEFSLGTEKLHPQHGGALLSRGRNPLRSLDALPGSRAAFNKEREPYSGVLSAVLGIAPRHHAVPCGVGSECWPTSLSVTQQSRQAGLAALQQGQDRHRRAA